MTNLPRRILFITFDVIGPRIGGSAIRVLGLACGLAELGHCPIVITPHKEDGHPNEPFPIQVFEMARPRESLSAFLADADLIVLPLQGLARFPFLNSARIPLVFDLYDPVVFELIESAPRELASHIHALNRVLQRGDFFLCASERQRDFWLGTLAANGRVTQSEARNLIDVVPFGIDPGEVPSAVSGRPNLTAAIPALTKAEKILVWPGGIWDWTDPEILIRAMQTLAVSAPEIHLVFFAGRHPSAGHIHSAVAGKARALAEEFQLCGRSVHFIDDYIPYQARGKYLAECDAAVSTHRANLESRFAYRTRLLDCIWAGLPIVCTEGDVLSEMIVRREMGIAVPAGDVSALASAIERMTTDAEFAANCRRQIAASRESFAWSDAIEPLARFCEEPRRTNSATFLSDAGTLVASAWTAFKTHGLRETFRRVEQHLRSR